MGICNNPAEMIRSTPLLELHRIRKAAGKLSFLAHDGAEIVLIDNTEFLAPGAIHTILDRIRRENPGAYFTEQRGDTVSDAGRYLKLLRRDQIAIVAKSTPGALPSAEHP